MTWDIAFKAGYHQREIDPLDKEDRCEKCYEQGIKEVAGWLETCKMYHYAKDPYGQRKEDSYSIIVSDKQWQAKLKEWGIK